ncbi:6671_t:CDS:1, partial [Scutellospora calospora]
NNRNDTVSWHRFGSGGNNNRSSIKGFLQKVDNFRRTRNFDIDEIKEAEEIIPPDGTDNDSYSYL